MPNLGSIQDHLKTILEGKIGILAKELAEEMKGEFSDFIGGDVDSGNINPKDIFKNFVKNPNKIKELIGRIKDKLEEKMKSGNISRDELMKEASDLVDKMKNTPGMKNMESMLNKMGLGGMGGNKGGKVNMNLFQSMMKKNIKKSSQRDRMLKKLKERQLEKHIKQELEKKMKQENQRLQNNKVQQSKPNDNDDFDEYIQKSFNIGNSVIKKSKIRKNRKGKNKNKNKNRKKNKK